MKIPYGFSFPAVFFRFLIIKSSTSFNYPLYNYLADVHENSLLKFHGSLRIKKSAIFYSYIKICYACQFLYTIFINFVVPAYASEKTLCQLIF